MIHAGQGVMYAEACDELLELAELLQVPVMTTLEGKGAFPEDHPLALGTGGGGVMPDRSTTSCARPTSCSVSGAASRGTAWPRTSRAGKTIIHATNDERDLNKSYAADHPILGDAKLVLRQFIDAVKDSVGPRNGVPRTPPREVEQAREAWLAEWMPKLTSDEVPITPYRVIWDFMQAINPRRGHRDPRLGQPARPAGALLSDHRAARLHGLGQVARARHRAGPDHGRQAGRPRQVLRELHGRRGLRHDRARLRDRRPLRHSDHHHRPQQLGHGHRAARPGRLARSLPHARHRRQLRRHGARDGRPGGAGREAGGDRARARARPQGERRRARRSCSSSSPARRSPSPTGGRCSWPAC